MPWLSPSQDPTFAELAARSSISGGGGISPALLRPPPNQWEELLKTVAPIIKDYIQKKKSDEIANQLQNMYVPPRAEALDPRSYNQLLAAEQGLISERAPQATMPFTGGAEQFKVAELYRQQQQEAEDRELKRRQIEAQINARGEPRVPIQIDGQTYYVTPNAALEHFDRVRRPATKKEFEDIKTLTGKEWSEWNRLAENDLARIGTDDSGNVVGEFETGRDKQGNPIYERRSMPVELFEQARERYRTATGQSRQAESVTPQEVKYKTPPLDTRALAEKALNDPEASPEHKAAARKILGL